MSLLRKTLLYLFLVAVPVAIGGGWLFHTLIYRGIRYEVDEQLSSDLTYVNNQLTAAGTLPGPEQYLGDPHIAITPTSQPSIPLYLDTLEYDQREKELVPIRELRASTQVGRQMYLVTVKQAMGEFDEIARLLSASIIVAFLLLLGFLVGLNSWVSRRLWQPFYQLIEQLSVYRLDSRAPATFADNTTIDEFRQLRLALNTMSQNLHRQYTVQKEFTDHAAHEMQTPLAVITAQLDQLLGTEPLTTEQVTYLEQTQGSVRRLVQLNRSLLLLTKIDNNQFVDRQSVNLSEIVEKQVRNLESYAHHRHLNWISVVTPNVCRSMNAHLAEVLVSNLIKNVLVHALPNTETKVVLTNSYLKTVNEAPPLPFPAEQLFGRFVKNPSRPESTGLGLALVWQIADRYNQTVHHHYDALTRLHTFTVLFPAN